MICKRCGTNNPDNVKFCAGCGEPMSASDAFSAGKNKKQSSNVTVAIITILTTALIVITGVCIVLATRPQSPNQAYDNVDQGPAVVYDQNGPVIVSSGNIVEGNTNTQTNTVPDPEPEPEPEPRPEPKPEPKPETSQASNVSNIRMERKNSFLKTASEIEEYAEIYYEGAETQHEINYESGVVFNKWDALLNDVYQYLKTILPSSEFEELRKSEVAWVNEKERAIEEAAADWGGGSGEAMIRNGTGIRYTRERCYYLISLIN